MEIILGVPAALIDLLLAFGVLFLFKLSHVFLVRIRLLRFQISSLLVLSFVWLGVYGILVQTWGGGPLVLSSASLYFLFSLFYTAECTQIDSDSPSLTIMKFLEQRPDQKATYEVIEKLFLSKRFVVSRLEDLESSGFISLKGERYILRPRGKLVARIFGWYRRLLRRGLGG